MKISTITKYGGSAKENRDGFKLSLVAELSDAQLAEAAAIGLASIAYRAGANVINSALGVDSNSGAEYSDEAADKLASALTEWAANAKESPLTGGFRLAVNTERHVHGVTDVVMKDERAAYGRNADKLDKLAAKVGYTGNVGDGTPANAPVEFLRAIRAWTNEQLKSLEV